MMANYTIAIKFVLKGRNENNRSHITVFTGQIHYSGKNKD